MSRFDCTLKGPSSKLVKVFSVVVCTCLLVEESILLFLETGDMGVVLEVENLAPYGLCLFLLFAHI